MKHILYLLFLFISLPICALPLGKEAKQEARLFNAFLEAVDATPDNPLQTFTALEQVLALDPESKYIRRLLVSLAVSMNKTKWAEPYVDFIEMGENDEEDLNTYAAYVWQTGQIEKAQELYEKSLDLNPDNNQTLYQYLLLLSSLNGQQAAAALERLALRQPAVAGPAYLALGQLFARHQQFAHALAYLDKAVEAEPDNPDPRLLKGDIYEKTGQLAAMKNEFEELEKMGYANAGTLSRMGAVSLLNQQLEEAESYFLKAKAADTADAPANYFLAAFAEQRGDLEQAIRYLQDSAEYPVKESLWLRVSFYQKRLNQPKESLHTLAQAYKKFPGNVEVGFFYGLALNDHKSYKQAASVFRGILETNPDYIDARLNYAYALYELGKYTDMEEQLKRILAKEPQHAAALNLYAYTLAERNERLEQAQEYIERALAVAPEEISFIDTQAWVYIRQGKLAEAETLLSSLPSQVVNNNAEIAYHLGFLRAEQGRIEEALSYLEQAKAGWPAAAKLYNQLQKK